MYSRVCDNPGAPGGVTFERIDKQEGGAGGVIPKANGKLRPPGIPAIRDRVVQMATLSKTGSPEQLTVRRQCEFAALKIARLDVDYSRRTSAPRALRYGRRAGKRPSLRYWVSTTLKIQMF
jgi:hypothetical protein